MLKKLLDLKIMQDGVDEKRGVTTRRRGVEVMARYIVCVTFLSPPPLSAYTMSRDLPFSTTC